MNAKPEFSLVDTNGIRLRVARAGKGPLIVLVHGWPESWYSWRHQIPPLAAAGYRVAAVDVRGYGGSECTWYSTVEYWRDRPYQVGSTRRFIGRRKRSLEPLGPHSGLFSLSISALASAVAFSMA
jgi:pimeloyl-ACP methyl ester carboxylesterase